MNADTHGLPTSPVAEGLGFHVLGFDAEAAEVRCAFAPALQHTNQRGQVHGGSIAGMLDISGLAAAMLAAGDGSGFATAQMTTSYLRSVPLGPVRSVARVTRQGRSLTFVEARLLDGQERPLVTASLVCSRFVPGATA